jgi:cell division GTPase FtsZ
MGDETLSLADLEEALSYVYEQLGSGVSVQIGSTLSTEHSSEVNVWVFLTGR